MIEMFKLCGLLGKRNRDYENLKKEEKIDKLISDENTNVNIEMENKRSDTLYSDKDEENEDKNGVIIPKSDFPFRYSH